MGWLEDNQDEPSVDYSTPDFSYDDSSSVPLTLGDSLVSSFGESPASSYSAGQSSQARDPSLDAMGILKDALAANSRQIDGITAHRDKLRDERNSLSQTTTNDWSGVGSAILTGLAGLAVGGSAGAAATAGGRSGVSYYNNLDADEKQKGLNLENDIKFDDSMIGKLTDYGKTYTDQQATFTHADALQANSQAATDARQTQSQAAARSLANDKGELVETPEWDTAQQAKQDLAESRRSAVSGGLDQPVSEDVLRKNAAMLGIDADKAIANGMTNREYGELLRSNAQKLQGERSADSQKRFEIVQQLNKDKGKNISEKAALDLGGVASLANDVKTGIDSVNAVAQKEFGGDPSLGAKAFAQLPLGDPLRDAFQRLVMDGAIAAKLKEGRVNETTLKLYTQFLTSMDTEPLSAVQNRAQIFQDALKQDLGTKLDFLQAAGKDVSGIRQLIGSPSTATGGSPSGFNAQDPGFLAWKQANGR